MKIIISGHGDYAKGVISGIETIIAKSELIALNFNEEVNLDQFRELANELIDDEDTIVLCDLFGGTPFQVFSALAIAKSNVKVLAGINNGAIIENYFKKDTTPLDELANNILSDSIKATQMFTLSEVVETVSTDGGI